MTKSQDTIKHPYGHLIDNPHWLFGKIPIVPDSLEIREDGQVQVTSIDSDCANCHRAMRRETAILETDSNGQYLFCLPCISSR